MVKIPYIDSKGQLSVKVHLQSAGNVFLVDSTNYQKYKRGQKFKFHGGYSNKTPVRIDVIGVGRWYLIVENAGKYSFEYLQR